MRYAVAGLISLLILLGGVGWYQHLRMSVKEEFRADFQRAKDAGGLPPEMQNIEFETVWQQGFGGEVSSSTMMKIQTASLLRGLWYVWVVLVCGLTFGIAHWMSPKVSQQESRE